jgi:hypothetical protein
MSIDDILFFNRKCKQNRHLQCLGLWFCLVFQWYCESKCHQEKNQPIEKVVEPASINIGPSLSEDSNEGLMIENKSAVGTNHSSTDKPVTSSGPEIKSIFSRELNKSTHYECPAPWDWDSVLRFIWKQNLRPGVYES